MNFDAFFFGVFPYVAVAIAVVGCYFRAKDAARTITTKSSQILASKSLKLGSTLFHFGLVGLFFGHLFGLFTPHHLYESLGLAVSNKQKIEIAAGLIVSPITLLGIAILLQRRLFDPQVRAISTRADIAALLVIGLQVLLGFATISQSIHHLDGSVLLKLCGWTQGLLVLDIPGWEVMAAQHWIYKAHIVLGFLLMALIPFTKLIHILGVSSVLHYIVRPWQTVRGVSGLRS